ncbi:MAG: CotH kinase family protein, partial [Deltaproteobacteria bacterium]|nr:CotH kinase family protein [Deltaproteobacteria bacterium]
MWWSILAGCGPGTLVAPPEVDHAAPPGLAVVVESVGAAGVTFGGVALNELQPSNDSTITDEAGDFDDWVELYATEAVALDGWALGKWLFPPGTAMAAGGRLIVWLDDEPAEGTLHATVGLDADGDVLELVAPDGSVVDTWTIAGTGPDVVLGRFPDGDPFVSPSILATPGEPNPADPGLSVDATDQMFPTDAVIRVELELSAGGQADLDADPYTAVPGALIFDGVRIEPVGIALKGQAGSLRDLDHKAAFRIEVDQYLPGQWLRGLENITLNNMVQDDSCFHETVAYELFREAGIPSPRVAHAEVYLNGEYRGLYLHVESPDEQFLARWFANPNGNLYEGEYGQDVTLAWVESVDLDQQGSEDVADRSDLVALGEVLALPPSEEAALALEALVDIDTTMLTLAGEVVIGHVDGYFAYPNNWRMYHDPSTGQFTLLPWGVDQTFLWAVDPYDPYGDLAWWMLEVPSLRVRYDLALWDLADRLAAMDVAGLAAQVGPRIEPFLATDPYREGSVEEMVGGMEGT